MVDEVAALEAQVCADLLVDGPGEFLVQFPGDEAEEGGAESDYAGHGDQVWPHRDPQIEVVFLDVVLLEEGGDGIADLVHLDGRVDQDCQVVGADADDLDGVLLVQRVVHEHELVDEAEDEEGEVAGDGAGDAAGLVGVGGERHLELGEDIAASAR